METTRLVIKELFDESSFFYIPAYQRPYVWIEQQVGQLIIDIQDAHDTQVQQYFLGSIVLVAQQGRFEIVDGQQRITSLTILCAVLRELFDELHEFQLANEIHAYIHVEHKKLSKINGGPRLDGARCEVLRHYIQERHKLADFIANFSPKPFTSEERLKKNAEKMYLVLREFTLPKLISFAQYMLTECMLIRITTTEAKSAYKIFNSLNGRGTPLKSIDILKAEILSADIGAERNHIEAGWNEYEDSLGVDKFKELFHHMYVIKSNKFVKAESFVTDFESVFAPTTNPIQFFNMHFFPCARAMEAVVKSDIGSLCNDHAIKEQINKLLWMLNKNEYEQWIPVVIYYLTLDKTRANDKLNFLKKMERCWAFHLLKRTRIDERKAFCLQLLAEMHHNNLLALDQLLNLTHIVDWKEEMRDIINTPLYLANYNACRYLLLRINCEMSCEAQAWRVCDTTLSIEHILPRTLTDYWSNIWKTTSYKAHLQKIGNLTLLTRKINSQVQNSSFEEKKKSFLSDKHEQRTSTLPITTDIQKYKNWTVEEFKKRQSDFCQRLYGVWEISTASKTHQTPKSDVPESNTNKPVTHATVKVSPKPTQKKEKKEKKGNKRAREDVGLLDETAQSEPAAKRQKLSNDACIPQFPSIQESAQLSANKINSNNNNNSHLNTIRSAEKSPVAKPGRKTFLQKLVENDLVKVGAEVQIDIENYTEICGSVGADGMIDGMHPIDWMAAKLPADVRSLHNGKKYPWTKLRLKETSNNGSILLSSIKKPKKNAQNSQNQ